MSSVIGHSLILAIVVMLIAVIAAALLSMPAPEPIHSLDTVSTCISGDYSCMP